MAHTRFRPVLLQDEVQPEDDQKHGGGRAQEPGEIGEHANVRGRVVQHRSPARDLIGEPEADVRERGFRHDERGDEQRDLDREETASSTNTSDAPSTSGRTDRSASDTYIAGSTMTKSVVRISTSSSGPP